MTIKRFAIGSGRFNTKVVIEKQGTPNVDEFGNDVADFVDHAERWASVMPSNGREFQANEQVQAEVDHVVTMLYDRLTKLIDPEMRIRIKGTDRLLNVVSVLNVGLQNQELKIGAKELVNG